MGLKHFPNPNILYLIFSAPGPCKTYLHLAQPKPWRSCFPATPAFGRGPHSIPRIFRAWEMPWIQSIPVARWATKASFWKQQRLEIGLSAAKSRGLRAASWDFAQMALQRGLLSPSYLKWHTSRPDIQITLLFPSRGLSQSDISCLFRPSKN